MRELEPGKSEREVVMMRWGLIPYFAKSAAEFEGVPPSTRERRGSKAKRSGGLREVSDRRAYQHVFRCRMDSYRDQFSGKSITIMGESMLLALCTVYQVFLSWSLNRRIRRGYWR